MALYSSPLLISTPLTIAMNSKRLMETPEIEILPQQRIALMGDNGVGKTTLFKTLAKLHQPEQGQVTFPLAPRGRFFSKWFLSQQPWLCYLHQQPYLFDGSVQQNVFYNQGSSLNHNLSKIDEQRLLDKLKVTGLLKKHISMLSGGERQRVAIARALIKQPKVLLLDEVIANIDQQMLPSVIELLNDFIDQGGSYLITCHHDNNLTDLCQQQWRIDRQQLFFT